MNSSYKKNSMPIYSKCCMQILLKAKRRTTFKYKKVLLELHLTQEEYVKKNDKKLEYKVYVYNEADTWSELNITNMIKKWNDKFY